MSDEWKRLTQEWKALTHPRDQRRNLLVLLVVAPVSVFAILALWIGLLLHSERLFGVQPTALALRTDIALPVSASMPGISIKIAACFSAAVRREA